MVSFCGSRKKKVGLKGGRLHLLVPGVIPGFCVREGRKTKAAFLRRKILRRKSWIQLLTALFARRRSSQELSSATSVELTPTAESSLQKKESS
jgi:hypothetical protein